jgi:hypothetical protein
MEIADFVHLDDQADPPIITLIHVKGAKSESPKRKISVSGYEVVTGQAVKNLRFLDRLNLGPGLEAGLDHKIGKLVWHNREPTTREEMVARLGELGHYRKSVVVLQPHVTQSRLNAVRKDDKHEDVGRLRQLDTLLLSAQASIQSLGAELIVLSDDR